MLRHPSAVVLALSLLAGAATAQHTGETRARRADPAPAEPSGQDVPDALVREHFGLRAFEPARVVLPARDAERMVVPVEAFGERLELVLTRHDLRAPEALVRVQGADGLYREERPPAPRTYRGFVAGRPGTSVVASLSDAGLTADVLGDPRAAGRADGAWTDWSLRPLAELDPRLARERHVAWRGEDAEPPAFTCGAPHEAFATSGPALALGKARELDPVPFCLQRCEIAFDADYEYYLSQGGTVPATIARIDAHMNQVDFFYARDVRITYQITGYVVRTALFYTPTSGGDLLDQFRLEWQANQSPVIPYDVAHLMTAKDGNVIQYGGLAYVGVVCNLASGYGWSLDSAGIIGHEVGHNWNAPHCLDPSPCNNMCGACLYVAPITKRVIEAHRDSRACLDVVGPYATAVPPYAYPDRVDVRKNELAGLADVRFDVLANDEDGNCEPLALDSFDVVSELGGTIALSAGTGPRGRDELSYTPPAGVFVGEDRFGYVVRDAVGMLTGGTATFEVEPLTLDGYWKLDESGGNSAADAAGSFTGTYLGSPLLAQGPAQPFLQSSVAFDGVNDRVRIPVLGLDSNRVTMAAWVRRQGPQPANAGLFMSRDGTTVAGLRLGAANELRYAWDDDPVVEAFDSGLVLPDDAWVLVALVVEPSRATLYMGDAGGLASAVHVHPHRPEAFDGLATIGRDALPGRYFQGLIDDVRVYDYALSAAGVAGLLVGGGARAPLPADGGRLVDPEGALAWTAGTGGGTHDVYFGTDPVAVAAATTASPEYLGNVSAAALAPGGLADGPTYFWRVDEVVGPDVVPGPLWQFTLAERYRWRLDETSGSLAAEDENGQNGTYFNGIVLGVPGATASLGTAVHLDGVNDHVRLPALDLDSASVTITGWIKREGAQAAFAGIVFSRDASTTAGLNFGNADELRYHWNDDGSTWSWNSGLVPPDGVWVFVALVVEPTRATIWLGDGGSLSSAVNVVNHSPEEFDGLTRIGSDQAGGRWFRGDLDDVRIYDAALSAAEVDALYQSSL